MSISAALQTPKLVEIDGQQVEFPRIDGYDLASIDESRKANLKLVAKANAKDANLEKADVYNICMDIDSRDFSVGEILGYATTPKGATNVLERSLSKRGINKDDAKKLITSLEPVELVNLASELILRPKRDKENPPKAEADTQATAASQPATTSTPSESTPKTSQPVEPKGFGD